MPLRCLDETRASVHAFAIPERAWADLTAANQARRHLRMPCCDARVSLKRSTLGTQFFAHHKLGECATRDESAEHLALKQLAVEAARRNGWHAETEVAADDASWRADVLATRGRHRVAIEIQWSQQTDKETLRRQAQYAAAGVRALWLFRQPSFPASDAVPAVRVGGSVVDGFTALDLPVSAVLDAAFEGRFKFGIPAGTTARVRVMGCVEVCWGDNCGALTRVVRNIDVIVGDNVCQFTLSDLSTDSELLIAVRQNLPADPQRGAIKSRFSRTLQQSYVSNGCYRCDRMFGQFHAVGGTSDASQLVGFNFVVSPMLSAVIAQNLGYDAQWSVIAADPPLRVAPLAATR